MRSLQILAIATTIELCVGGALLALAAFGGAVNPWLDLINSIAPLFVVLGVAGALAVVAALPRDRRRMRLACLCAAAWTTAYGLLMTAPELVARLMPERSPAQGRPYHLVTANVFSKNNSPFSAARTLVQRDADALIVEEADGTIQRVRGVLAARYPFVTTCGLGVDIWLKTPILAQGCRLPAPRGSYHAWGEGFAWARTLGPDGKPITIVAVHFGRPYPPGRQRVEQNALPATLAPLTGERTILAGDLNTAPWSFAMHRLDGSLRPLRRHTLWQATYPARLNVTQAEWGLPVLPIDHIYAGSAWSGFRITRFRTPSSDHFALDAQTILRP